MIQNIVFDLGGVLVQWNPLNLYRKIFGKEEQAVQFLGEVCTYEWNLEQDRGRTIREATEQKIAEFPEYREEISAYYGRWHEMFSGIIPENVAILNQYFESKAYRIYALTNWSGETFPIALQLFPFLGNFEGAVVSGEVGFIKPEPAIYQILLDKYGLVAEECVFIDDRWENVETALAMNFKGIHYKPLVTSLANELDLITSLK